MSDAKVDVASAAAPGANEIGNSANLTLPELAAKIREAFKKVNREQIGGWLIQAKRLSTEHGQFMKFVKDNLPGIPHRTATSWMKMAGAKKSETDCPKRETARPGGQVKKKLDAALKMLVGKPADVKRLDPANLEKLANIIVPLVPSGIQPLDGGAGGVRSFVSIAQLAVNCAKIANPLRGNQRISEAELDLLIQGSEILAACVAEIRAARVSAHQAAAA